MKYNDSRFPFEMYSISGNGSLVPARCSATKMEIVEVTAGNVKIQIGTETIDASVGDFLYVPHGLVYKADAADG